MYLRNFYAVLKYNHLLSAKRFCSFKPYNISNYLFSVTKNGGRTIREQVTDSRISSVTCCRLQCQRYTSNDIPKEYNHNEIIVYSGPLKTTIKIIKIFSLTTSAAGFLIQPYILYKMAAVNIPVTVAFALISSLFLITPLLLHWITKKYVIELRFNPESKIFTATTLTLFTRQKEVKYTANDVHVPDVPGFLSSYVVGKTPLFVDSRMIEDPDAYSHMMGYDKPIDFKLGNSDEKNNLKHLKQKG